MLRRGPRWGLGLAVLALTALSAAGQQAAPPGPDQWLPHLRPGQWIKVEGLADPRGGLRAKELKIYTGERDESQITAAILSLDPARKSFRTGLGMQVITDRRTEVQGREKHHQSFSLLQPGMRVEAEGTLRKDGALLAEEVEIQKPKKSGDKPDDDEITGRIESVDLEARKLVLLGIPVFFDDQTRLKSPIPD
jgi:hypothetical protein